MKKPVAMAFVEGARPIVVRSDPCLALPANYQ